MCITMQAIDKKLGLGLCYAVKGIIHFSGGEHSIVFATQVANAALGTGQLKVKWFRN